MRFESGDDVLTYAELLEARPDDVPIPPSFDLVFAPVFLESRPEYVDFENGTGIRYLTHMSQDFTGVAPIYMYVGLTDDGLYLVQFRVRITSIALNISDEINEFYNQGDLSENYSELMAVADEILTTSTPDTFYPDLSEIDGFINSLSVGLDLCNQDDEA